MKKLTGALIGCGAIAREHLAAVADLESVDIIAVCDLSAARAQSAADRFGISKWYVSHLQLISELRPDLIHITAPPSAHFAIARDCLSSGLNVLCEKPITVRYEDFQQLRRMATENGCQLTENQNFRFHSSIQRICQLRDAGELGDVLDVQVCLQLDLFGIGSAYVDPNAPHPTLVLRGGVIGDFLPHIAYLVSVFVGRVIDLRTTWIKHTGGAPLPADEFRGFIKGERATAYVSFSGNGQPDGFWVRVTGTKAHAEANLFEPPRLSLRRLRAGEPALTRLVDGVAEARSVLGGSVTGFWRKLGGTSSYDGLPEMIRRTYAAIATGTSLPVTLEEVDETARLVDRFTAEELKL